MEKKLSKELENTVGKGEIARYESVFKRLVSQRHQKVSLCGNGLTLYHTILTFNDPKEEGFGKHWGKRRKCWQPVFSLFSPSVFYSIEEKNCHFSSV